MQHTKVPADLSKFYVVTVISNPRRFKRRYELYLKFAEMCQASGVNLITVEQAFGERQFMVTESNNPMHVQVRGVDEIWIKENMMNLGAQRAALLGAREVAALDADCFAMIPFREWMEATWHALQHYEIVQMWQWLLNFGPNDELIGDAQPSFMYFYEAHDFSIPKNWWAPQPATIDTKPLAPAATDYVSGSSVLMPGSRFRQDQFGRPGLGWAMNVTAGNHIGWWLDKCILGSGDWHGAHSFVGACTEQTTLVGTLKGHGSQEYAIPTYTQYILSYQERCEHWIKRDVGYVPVTVGHWWHGKYKDRKYGSRGKILVENQYNPYTDIKYDVHGVLQLETVSARQIRLRDQCRAYFKERMEDSIDV